MARALSHLNRSVLVETILVCATVIVAAQSYGTMSARTSKELAISVFVKLQTAGIIKS